MGICKFLLYAPLQHPDPSADDRNTVGSAAFPLDTTATFLAARRDADHRKTELLDVNTVVASIRNNSVLPDCTEYGIRARLSRAVVRCPFHASHFGKREES